MVKLRPATLLDAKNLFRWKNDATVRRFAIKTHNKIEWVSHVTWLRKNLSKIQIITMDGIDVGDVRIDNGEIAIKIDKRYRNQGIGSAVLRKFPEKLTAKIVEGNIPSMRLFIGAGFVPVSYKKGVYIFKSL